MLLAYPPRSLQELSEEVFLDTIGKVLTELKESLTEPEVASLVETLEDGNRFLICSQLSFLTDNHHQVSNDHNDLTRSTELDGSYYDLDLTSHEGNLTYDPVSDLLDGSPYSEEVHLDGSFCQ